MTQNTPASNTNQYYLAFDGYDFSGKLTEVSQKGEVDTEDVTAGAGTEHVQKAPKLRDSSGSFTVAYIAGAVPQYINRIKPGTRANMVYGPEGTASGKPKHQQDVIIKSVDGPAQTVDKQMVMFSGEWEAADAPMVDIYAGGTFA